MGPRIESLKLTEGTFVFVGYFLLALIVLIKVILSPGTIGLNHDWSMPHYSSQILQQKDLLETAVPGELAAHEPHFVGYLGILPQLLLAEFGFGGPLISKSYLVFSLTLAGTSMYLLCRRLRMSAWSSVLGGFVYMFGPISLNRISAGHIYHLFSFAFAPLVLYFAYSALQAKSFLRGLRYGLVGCLLFVISMSQLQVGFMVLVVVAFLTMHALLSQRGSLVKRGMKLIPIMLYLVSGYLAYLPWFLPKAGRIVKFVAVTTGGFSEYWLVSQFQNASIIKALELQVGLLSYAGSAVSTFGALWHIIALLFVVSSILSVVIAERLRGFLVSLAALAVLFIFLSSGSSLSQSILIALFRTSRAIPAFIGEMENLTYVPALVLPILFAYFFDRLSTRGSSRSRFFRLHVKLTPKLLFTFIAALYALPFALSYASHLQTYSPEDSYNKLFQWLNGQPERFRILWVPPVGEYGLTYKGLAMSGVDPMVAYTPKLSFPQFYYGFVSVGNPYNQGALAMHRLITMNLYDNKTQYFGYLCNLVQTRYVILRNDVKSIIPQYMGIGIDKYEELQSDFLSRQKDLKPVWTIGSLAIFENIRGDPLINVINPFRSALIAGDLSILIPLSYASSEGEIGEKPLVIFTSQLTGDEIDRIMRGSGTVIVDPENLFDIYFAHLPDFSRLYATKASGASWGGTPYFPQIEYASALGQVEGALLGSRTQNQSLMFSVDHEGRYEIWAKIMSSPKSAGLSFSIDSIEIGHSQTRALVQFFRWIKVGQADLSAGRHELRVRALGEVEGISLAAVVRESDMSLISQKIRDELSRAELIVLLHAGKAAGQVLSLVRDSDAADGLSVRLQFGAPISYDITFPVPGKYEVSLRLKSSTGSQINLSLDGSQAPKASIVIPPSDNFGWYHTQLLLKSPGHYRLALSADNETIANIILFKPNHRDVVNNGDQDMQAAFRRIAPDQYDLHVSSNSSFFVLRGTTYSELWRLMDSSGSSFTTFVGNAFEGGYSVPLPGRYDLRLTTVGRDEFKLGWQLTLVFYAVLVSTTVWLLIRVRNNSLGGRF